MRLAILLALIPLAGCVMPAHQPAEPVIADIPESVSEVSPRGRLHLFIINGSDPFVSMSPLRKKLNEAGFHKVSSGGLFYTASFESTIRALHADDPDTRFVLVGYRLGVASVDNMATRLVRDGIPVETVLALAPLTIVPGDITASVNRIIIRAKASPLEAGDQHAYDIPGAISIASDAAAMELALNVVRESLAGIPMPEETPVAVLPIIDDPAPLPRAPVAGKPVKGILTGTSR